MMPGQCPIQSQISSAEETITKLMERIRVMEDCLESPDLPEEKRHDIETELIEITKLLTTNKELLAGMRKENSKSYAIAASIVFIGFFLYGLYAIMYLG